MLAVVPVLVVSVTFLSYALGTLCPILTGLLTKLNASAQVKAILNALLACLAGLIAVAIKEQGHIDLYGWGTAFAEALIASWGAYNGLLRHLTPMRALQAKTANFGIGGSTQLPQAA